MDYRSSENPYARCRDARLYEAVKGTGLEVRQAGLNLAPEVSDSVTVAKSLYL